MVDNKLQEVRETKFLFKICPNHELSTSNVLKWIVNDVEAVTLDSELGLDTVAASSKVVFSTASGSSKGKDPATPDQHNIDDPLHAITTTRTPTYTPPPLSNTARDNAGPKQANAAAGRSPTRKPPAVRLNFNNTSYAELEEDSQQATQKEVLAGESQANEDEYQTEVGFDD